MLDGELPRKHLSVCISNGDQLISRTQISKNHRGQLITMLGEA